MGGAPASGARASARTCLDCDLAVVGRSLRCDGCKAQRNRDRVAKWQRENPEAYRARMERNYDRETAVARTAAWQAANPDRVAAQRAKQKTAETPEQRRDWYLRSKYGITLADQNAMLAAQGGACLLCDASLDAYNLAVDHDHETDEVRGLLCRICNSSLGAFEADPERLLTAFTYLTTSDRPWIVRATEEPA